MPHQCIGCEEAYADGSESVLSGCTSCGGTTFQYVPADVDTPSDTADTESDTPPTNADEADEETAHLGGGVISVGGDDADTGADSPEDASQHSARTDVVDADALPTPPQPTPTPENDGEYEVDLDALRRELNRQFEGIHIVAPGHYELNLMELYRREECIITLHEDGRYAIGMPGDEDFSLESEEN